MKFFNNIYNLEKKLHDEKIVLLLSRHQMLQEDYLRVKQYQNYMTSDDLKEQLKEVKKNCLSTLRFNLIIKVIMP